MLKDTTLFVGLITITRYTNLSSFMRGWAACRLTNWGSCGKICYKISLFSAFAIFSSMRDWISCSFSYCLKRILRQNMLQNYFCSVQTLHFKYENTTKGYWKVQKKCYKIHRFGTCLFNNKTFNGKKIVWFLQVQVQPYRYLTYVLPCIGLALLVNIPRYCIRYYYG